MLKIFTLVFVSIIYAVAFDIKPIDTTNEGKVKAQKQKELSKKYGRSEFSLAPDGKKIFKPIVDIVKPTVKIIKPTVKIIKAYDEKKMAQVKAEKLKEQKRQEAIKKQFAQKQKEEKLKKEKIKIDEESTEFFESINDDKKPVNIE
jgi:hypothetical protein